MLHGVAAVSREVPMVKFRCERCNETFTSLESAPRCPRCLRRSTVASAEGSAHAPATEPQASHGARLPPRLVGLLAILGAIPIGWYGWAVAHSERSTLPIAPVFAPPALLVLGAYALLVGRPIDPSTGRVRRWAAVGFWIALGLAFVAGTVAVLLAWRLPGGLHG
jgi:hypothetical protein